MGVFSSTWGGVGSRGGLLNSAPTDLTFSTLEIIEEKAIGDIIAGLSTTDSNSGNTFTYALVSGAGDTDNAAFYIDAASLKAAVVFNRDSQETYLVRVRSTDQGGLYFEKTVQIVSVLSPIVELDGSISNGYWVDRRSGFNFQLVDSFCLINPTADVAQGVTLATPIVVNLANPFYF